MFQYTSYSCILYAEFAQAIQNTTHGGNKNIIIENTFKYRQRVSSKYEKWNTCQQYYG